ncbi:sensor histidine kinase, partial [Rhodoflexus sp.]
MAQRGGVAVTRFVRMGKQLTLVRIDDRSAQKQAEQVIAKALQSAQEAAEAKSQFLSKVSHEIRTPLNAMVGLSRLMIEEPATISSQNIEVIYHASVSLLEMVNEILNFSKLETGVEILNEHPTDWREVLNKILTRIRWQAERKGLQLYYEADPAIPAQLVLDSLRFEQVINNLLSNALKFTEKVYVSIQITGTPLAGKRYRLYFRAADTGIGIPDEKKSIIFESFRQASQEIAYKFGGTGLGLAITKQLVEMMNGSISV